jgi:hypothetical protein
MKLKLPLYISSLAIACVAGIGLSTLSTKSVAVGATPTLSGSCGIAMYFARKGVPQFDTNALNGMGVINFDTKKVSGTINVFDSTKPQKARLETISWDFDVSAGMVEGSALITDRANSGKPTVQVLPVNGGNTFLIQFVDDDTVGVCQKI